MSIEELRDQLARRKVVLSDEFYESLRGLARAHAFTASGVTSVDQVEHLLELLADHIFRGGLFADWRNEVLANPRGIDLPNHRLELIYRNQMQLAYHAGRARHIVDNIDSHPYLMYDAIDDSRTRPMHNRMDGTIAPVRSAFWSAWYPPNGHNCRCNAIPITSAQAEALGGETTDIPEGDPDEGWGYSLLNDHRAGYRSLLDAVMRRVRPILRDALALFGL